MDTETITPAFEIGARVRTTDTNEVGTVTRIYPASGVPLYYGARRLIHTHCYEVQAAYGPIWGLVDALLVREESNVL